MFMQIPITGAKRSDKVSRWAGAGAVVVDLATARASRQTRRVCAAGVSEHAGDHDRRVPAAVRRDPIAVASRIERLAAEIRTARRQATSDDHLEELAHQLEYWQRVRRRQIASGEASDYGADTVSAGDEVLVGEVWWRVEACNRKTVRVSALTHDEVRKVAWHRVLDHRPRSDT